MLSSQKQTPTTAGREPLQVQLNPDEIPPPTQSSQPAPSKFTSTFQALKEEISRRTTKPWIKMNYAGTHNYFRDRLRIPADYAEEIQFVPKVPGSILIRLKKTTGFDKIKLNDPPYLESLEHAMEINEGKRLDKKRAKRIQQDTDFFRKLVIEGEVEPSAGMEDLYNHPLFRTNRIMRRLHETHLDKWSTPHTKRKLKPIQKIEPFNEYETSGVLFGWHPNHYRNTPNKFTSAPPTQQSSYTSSFEVESQESDEAIRVSDYEEEDEMSDENKLQLEKEIEDMTQFKSVHSALTVGGFRLASRFLRLSSTDLEKQFQLQRSRVLDQLYNDSEMTVEQLFQTAHDISRYAKRADANSDDFCNKIHRKAFT